MFRYRKRGFSHGISSFKFLIDMATLSNLFTYTTSLGFYALYKGRLVPRLPRLI